MYNTMEPIVKTLRELSELLGVQLQGDPSCLISGIAPLESAEKGDLAFLSNRQYKRFLSTTRASAVIISPEDKEQCLVHALISDNPRLSLAKVAKLFAKKPSAIPGIHPTAVIGEGCVIAGSASIGPLCVLGDNVHVDEYAVIGANCVLGNDVRIAHHTVLHARVTLYENVIIGHSTVIHSGAVLGSDGFGFASDGGNWVKMTHLGGVVIGDKVDIGANTTIDRGFLDNTTIGNGVIIDNLVQIAHNVCIGDGTAIAGCVGIAGSTKIGKSCLIGGGASIAGHIEIVDRVHITGTSAVTGSITVPGTYSSGFPAKPSETWRKNVARFHLLDNMAKRLKNVENRLEQEGQ